jgi:hypothetical protein
LQRFAPLDTGFSFFHLCENFPQNSTLVQLAPKVQLKEVFFLKNTSDKISAFLWSASSTTWA